MTESLDIFNIKLDKRKQDIMINSIVTQLDDLKTVINEIRQEQKDIKKETNDLSTRQQLSTLPMLEDIKKKFFGNGKPGLWNEHILCQNRVTDLEKKNDEIKKLRITVIGFSITIALATATFISTSLITWGRLNKTVEVNSGRLDGLESLHPRTK